MKPKNNALQELYDTLVSGNPTISPYAESPFDKAFRECDEKIQKDIDFLKCGNEILHSANMDLVNYKKKLEKERDNLLSRTHYAEDEVERLRKSHDELFDAGSRKISELRRENEAVNKKLEEEVEELKATLEELKKTLEKVNTDRTELQNDRDFYHGLYTEHRRDYDKLFEENKQIKKELHTAEEARNNLRAELEAKVKRMDEITKDRDFFFKMYHALKNDYKKLEAKYRDMKSYSNRYAEGYSDGKEEGEENLWDMLQNVRDVKPEEFDPECETLGDILDMDLEDFLDAYKNWQEEKEIENMRDYLERFCMGTLCYRCPLHTKEFNCSRGKWLGGISDDDVKRYYEKVRSAEAQKKIKDACDAFAEGLKAGLASEVKEVPVSCDIPIKNLGSWECTLEAKVEINKDLLEKVCGIKPDEEEHKLEYGDAVRLPWRDHDYMYIGPDGKEESLVRMFDLKNHAIVTSHIANVRYNGGKIVLTNEDDLRMIWKDKK